MFDRNAPFNDLPPLPPTAELESRAILKKAIAASRALAELKGMAERMPNQATLIDSLVLQEARASSEIENNLTTNDEFVQGGVGRSLAGVAEPVSFVVDAEGASASRNAEITRILTMQTVCWTCEAGMLTIPSGLERCT